ncbi:uncharacterized protein CCOS01_08458 [Colletotrichum costaricense]|uniref:Azaphilone pigments biosynthesis cluster protein L N-terminal domain-containing protein n=1 Tax=Colletotrichum costaricense TaxID=1209916 RepID=A0AAI9YVV6_9PEZI|nr:uncharacterized protein CCOS01_08458 [Colletotrichum costaricense]KAK1526040.1 hypothetical protein CCOS01_08458 [Colletotrichum costaricense]
MDPLSVSSGVAGLISLGLTVCKGLSAFCQDYRSRDIDIINLKNHAQRLDSFLQLVQTRFQASHQVDSALSLSLQNCFDACQGCVREFEALSKKQSRSTGPKGLKEHGKDASRHLQYPFQKAKFDRLRAELQELYTAMTHYLLLMNYDLTNELRQSAMSQSAKLASLLVSENQQTVSQIGALLHAVERMVDTKLIGLEQLSNARLKPILDLTKNSEGDSSFLLPKNETENPVVFSQSSSECHNDTTSSSHSIPTGQPNSIESTGITPFNTEDRQPKALRSTEANGDFATDGYGCSCRASALSEWHYRSKLRQRDHDSHCELFFMNSNRRAIKGTLQIFSTLLSWKVQLQYSQRMVIRDFQVHPTMTARSLVPDDAPSFVVVNGLVEKTMLHNIAEESLQAAVLSALRDLRCLFRNGKAWPSDLNSFDQTLLHRACNVNGHLWSDRMSAIWIQFMKQLILMGVPLNEATAYQGSALHWLLELRRRARVAHKKVTLTGLATGSLSLVKGLLELGAQSISAEAKGRTSVSEGNLLQLPDIYQNLSYYVDGFDYGALSCALLQRSEMALRKILAASPSSMTERGNLGQTPLHVATYWPRGLELLFELAGDSCRQMIDSEDATELTAIHSAVLLHQADSVEFLLKQGATIDLENTATFFGNPGASDDYHQSEKIISILSAELSSRRRKMLLFARRNLTEERLCDLGLTETTVLQENAFEVLQVLRTFGIEVPSIFQRVRRGSIYHSPIMSAQLAEALYRSGFDRVNSTMNGCTPLDTMRLVGNTMEASIDDLAESVTWFQQHGVDIEHPIPVFSYGSNDRIIPSTSAYTTLHRLAAGFGHAAKDSSSWERTDSRRSSTISLLSAILLSSSRDNCKCYCSTGGCSPATLFAKPWRKYMYSTSVEALRAVSMMKSMWDILSDIVALSHQEHRQALSDFVRVTTFDALGMSHSCCEHKFDHFLRSIDVKTIYDPIWMTAPNEVMEIQEEDQHLAITLDQLMEDLDAKLNEPDLDLRNFWLYWCKRVDEVEEFKEEIGCEDIRAIREIGVNLE